MNVRNTADKVNLSKFTANTVQASAFGAGFGLGMGLFLTTAAPMIASLTNGCPNNETEQSEAKDTITALVLGGILASSLAMYGVNKSTNCCSTLFGSKDKNATEDTLDHTKESKPDLDTNKLKMV